MKRLLPLGLVAGALIISGCSNGSSPASGTSAATTGKIAMTQTVDGSQIQLSASQVAAVKKVSKGKLIAIVCATLATQYHATLCNSAKALAQSLGFTAEIFNAQTNPTLELQGLQDFVSKGAYAILDDSLGSSAIENEVKQAVHKGVLVVRIDDTRVGGGSQARPGGLGAAAGNGRVRSGDAGPAIGAEPVARRHRGTAARAGRHSSVRGRTAFARST